MRGFFQEALELLQNGHRGGDGFVSLAPGVYKAILIALHKGQEEIAKLHVHLPESLGTDVHALDGLMRAREHLNELDQEVSTPRRDAVKLAISRVELAIDRVVRKIAV